MSFNATFSYKTVDTFVISYHTKFCVPGCCDLTGTVIEIETQVLITLYLHVIILSLVEKWSQQNLYIFKRSLYISQN